MSNRLARHLRLGPNALGAMAEKAWYPEQPNFPRGFLMFNSPFEDMTVFGANRSTLGPIVSKAVGQLGVTMSPDPDPSQGIFVRSDHYRFVQQGIPSVFLWPGQARWNQVAEFVLLPLMGVAGLLFVRQVAQPRRLGRLLDEMPNVYVEVGAILYDIGRQPRAAHDFFVRYQDRILFGKDSYQPEEYPFYFRVFETRDDYFDYYRDYHAFWKLYGIDLPDEVLKKVYFRNALKITPRLPQAGWP